MIVFRKKNISWLIFHTVIAAATYPARFAARSLLLRPSTRQTLLNRKNTSMSSSKEADTYNDLQERIDWKVRPATLKDKEAVDKLLLDSYKNLLANDYEAEFLTVALPLITKGSEELLTCGTWYVTEDPKDGSLTGCGGWTFRQPAKTSGGKAVPHLRHFGTRSDMARKGIGKAIWQRSWEDITGMSEDGSKTTLEVFSTLTAEPFYASCGFEKVKELNLPLSDECNFPCILMRREPK